MTPSDNEYRFDVRVRYASGTNIARCNGRTASSTNSPEIAALAAAGKHWEAVCAVNDWVFSQWDASSKNIGNGLHIVTFTRRAK